MRDINVAFSRLRAVFGNASIRGTLRDLLTSWGAKKIVLYIIFLFGDFRFSLSIRSDPIRRRKLSREKKNTKSDEKLVIVPSKAIHIDISHSLLDVDVEKSIVKLVYGDGRVKYYFFYES